MNAETKQIKFPNGSTIIFYSPKSEFNPRRVYGTENVFCVPVLDIEALKVFEKFACPYCEDGYMVAMGHAVECGICKGSGSLYREAASEPA